MDRSKYIFGNEMPARIYRKAVRHKEKLMKKYGDDTGKEYHFKAVPAPAVGSLLGVQQLHMSDTDEAVFDDKSVIIGNIRMGFGHYRISMAIASAVHSMGYVPYWFDLHSFEDTSCGRIIAGQNKLYSLGSRLSQTSSLFNKLFWERLNSEGFRRLSYNCSDQKAAELMTAVFSGIPKDIPYIATHVWPAQAALHAGMKNVINVVPDNWPMALHLSEGALHTVQTPSAYLGYRRLRGMDKKRSLRPMPEKDIVYTGHYIDHELVSNIEEDCRRRCTRLSAGKAKRWLLSAGGAGAQKDIFAAVVRKLLPYIRRGKASLIINVGDHRDMIGDLIADVPHMKDMLSIHPDDIRDTADFCNRAYSGELHGIHIFCHSDIFSAVYSTNMLMRTADVLITKPSELSFYPVPKLMIKRIGGHEAWGAIRSAEIGDGTYECTDVREICDMLSFIQNSSDVIEKMCESIITAGNAGIYDGAYRVAELAVRK